MNWRAVFAIVRKDLKIVLQNKGVIIPTIAVSLILFGVIPWLSALAPSLVIMGGTSLDEISALIEQMPVGLRTELAPYTLEQQTIVFFWCTCWHPCF